MHHAGYCGVLVALIALSATSPTLHTQAPSERVRGDELAASVNLTKNDVKLEGVLFVPANVKRIRAVIVVINFGASYLVYESQPWRRAAQTTESALLHVRVSQISGGTSNIPFERQVFRQASVGGGAGLLTLMSRLASESRHPELNDIPLAFWGYSAAAGFGPTFAELYPERTLAFIRYHTHQRGILINVNVTKNIPALFMAGGKDTTAGVEDAETVWKSGRAVGAPWTFIVEPNVPHSFIDAKANVEFLTTSNNLMIPWLSAIIRQRASHDRRAMRRIDPAVGWIADNRSGEIFPAGKYVGAQLEGNWLPDEETAREWQTVRETDNPGRPLE